MNEQIYLYLNEQQSGPYSIEQIKEMIEHGSVTSQTYAYDSASQNWLLITDIPAMKELFSGSISEEFYFYINNAQVGPYSAEDIQAKLKAGEIALHDYFFDKGTNGWIVFSESKIYAELNTESKTSTSPDTKNTAPELENQELEEPKEFAAESTEKDEKQNPVEETAVKKNTSAIQFPCKNHPAKESFLMCPECGMDFCEECLVKINGKQYCKECYLNNKEKIDAASKPAKGGFLSKLFNKKK